MKTLSEIESLARGFSEARRELEENVRGLEEEIAAAKRRRLPAIRELINQAAARKAALVVAIEESRSLFAKPKTHIFHGIRCGYAKAKGRITIADAGAVVALIRKHFPDRFRQLVKVSERPIKAALNHLPAADLKRIGVTVTDAGDVAIAQPTDSEIDKLVDALLGAGEEECEE
ncbi:host-nuclease inhibitor Gam family protein [Shumkonia mesophila]|uniref:host-nuclease inhibitor Gam family protein n=1 Tax=Shumkonia mesophila TaxID=2838854 RepID=UPI0029350986|nr:host-nuclease inhibitor Gam family protein [Shumkonia mesophila]